MATRTMTKTATKTPAKTLDLHHTTTPLGPFAVLVDGETVHAAGFTASGEELERWRAQRPRRRARLLRR
jgi:hypothetical protein